MATTAYTPGSGGFSTYAAQVKLAPGQSLHFQTGKGYYAGPAPANLAPAPPVAPGGSDGSGPDGPAGYGARGTAGGPAFKPSRTPIVRVQPRGAPPAPTPPVDPYAALSSGEIDKRATDMANAELSPQQAEIQRQAAQAKAQAVADEAAITGFRTAEGTILQGIAPQVGAGYEAAAAEEGALGQGLGAGAGAAVQSAEDAGQQFAESQGQSGGSTVSPTALSGSVSAPMAVEGDKFAEQGAAAQAFAAEQPAISLSAGREELDARMAQAAKDNDGYAQQLIKLAATFPGLKQQALTQLNQYELDKANYKRQLYDSVTQRRAEIANEKLAGIKQTAAAANTKQEFQYKWASLNFQSEKAAAAARAAAAKGKTIDVGASKLVGHIVYKDGTQDSSIKVKTSGTPTAQQRQKVISSASHNAFKEATTLYGKPIANKNVGTLTGGKGRYLASPGAKGKGVYPPPYKGGPATTDNPALAERSGQGAANYQDALQKVLASMAGSGLSNAQMARIAKQMLKAAGWKPGR